MKAIIYGIGKRFFELFTNQDFIDIDIIGNDIDIIGFVDGNKEIKGKEIIYNN